MDVSKINWPTKPEEYEIKRTIGHGASSLVQTAYCAAKDENVAVKIIDFEQANTMIEEIQKEIQAMHLCHHENMATYYTSFVNHTELWIIMKLIDGGSVLDLISKVKKHPSTNPVCGIMNENLIIAILKQVVIALQYFHSKGLIHRDVKSGNILISTDGGVQLADFGVSAVIMDHEDRNKIRKTFVGTPCWMAPEVMEQINGYNYKADIWSLGITAIEMATGDAPYSGFPPLKVLILTLNNPPPTLDTCRTSQKDPYKQYSKSFRKFIGKCLQKDPALRPDTTDILKMKIFRNAKDKTYLAEQFNRYGACLINRTTHLKPKSNPDAQWQKVPCGFWVWPENDAFTLEHRETTVPEIVSNADVTAAASNSVPAIVTLPTEDDGEYKRIYGIILRIRNKHGDTHDIFFNYDSSIDSPQNVVAEMVIGEYVSGYDQICVTANLEKMVDPKFGLTTITFKLNSQSDLGAPDLSKLIGYAQLTIDDLHLSKIA